MLSIPKLLGFFRRTHTCVNFGFSQTLRESPIPFPFSNLERLEKWKIERFYPWKILLSKKLSCNLRRYILYGWVTIIQTYKYLYVHKFYMYNINRKTFLVRLHSNSQIVCFPPSFSLWNRTRLIQTWSINSIRSRRGISGVNGTKRLSLYVMFM